MPYPVVLTRVSGVAAISMRWKGKGSGDDVESEMADCRPTETPQGSAKAARPRGSGKSRAFRR